jgi:cystathionine beta-lyase/cystathionine gamma-synthase
VDFHTKLQHPPQVKLADDNQPLVQPLHLSVKYEMQDLDELARLFKGERQGFFYGRKANPTVTHLERLIADLEGEGDTIAFASGIAAISHTLLALLKSGDEMICFYESYMPTRLLGQNLFAKFGIKTHVVHYDDVAAIERLLARDNVKVIISELMTNPMLFVPDLPRIQELCAKHDVLLVTDETFSGFNFSKPKFGDLRIHSLTKYAAGHSDALGGTVSANTTMIESIRGLTSEIGGCLGPHSAYLAARGIKTYALRRERQCESALKIAQWLESHPKVSRVHYPGLKSHPNYVRAQEILSDFGGVVSFTVAGGEPEVRMMIESFKWLRVAASLGANETIIAPAKMFFGVDLNAEQSKRAAIQEGTVRLSIGLESVADIIEELSRGLEK